MLSQGCIPQNDYLIATYFLPEYNCYPNVTTFVEAGAMLKAPENGVGRLAAMSLFGFVASVAAVFVL